MSATIGATGPDNHRGTLHGTITPEGMSGTIHVTRFQEDGTEDLYRHVVVGRSSDRLHVQPRVLLR
jgi:hypothetical protein